ncbi:MAG: hypothetical protein ACYC91_17055 [Solirubrobacteraceae bacterium]
MVRTAARSAVLQAVAVGALSVALAVWTLRLWTADLAAPLRYAPVDDTKFYLMLVKGIVDHGWYVSNSSLGAPFGEHLADFPQGADTLNLLLIRGLALLSSNAALIFNLFYLATFALAAAVAHLVLRAEGVSPPVAAVAAVMFSLLTYHFFRGESHLLLSAYYAVPLAAHLFLRVLGERPLFARASGSRRLTSWCSRRSLATVALCVVIGSDNLYYAAFALVLLAGASAVSLVLRNRSAALAAALAVLLVIGTLGANLAPSLIYRFKHGPNPVLVRTAAADEGSSEALSLRVTNLVLPPANSRIAPLARLAARYDRSIAPGYCEGCYASLGTVGTIGFLWLAACALGTLVAAGAWYGGRRAYRHASAGVMIALSVGTVGGISSLIELLVTPDIRGWDRISVTIAFFSLLAAGLGLDVVTGWIRGRPGGRLMVALTLTMVLAAGVYDQTSASDASGYASGGREYRSDGAFVAAIQARLPRGASVFQLPYVPFPEGYPSTPCCGAVPTFATKYEPLRGYLHSSTLRWSYGAMKGRPADWAAQLAGQPLSYLLAAVSAAGFDGLWVDPAGFAPATARRLQAALGAMLRQAPMLSPQRDLWFFDLRPYAARLRRREPAAELTRLGELTLHPLRVSCAPGGLLVVNPSASARPALLNVVLSGGSVNRRVTLAPGSTFVSLKPAQTPGRVLYATATDLELTRFDRMGGSAGGLVVGLNGPGCGH